MAPVATRAGTECRQRSSNGTSDGTLIPNGNAATDVDVDVVRVAIIGSGLTGLVAAYLLSSPLSEIQTKKKRVQVEMFESAPTLGMDAASLDVPLPQGTTATAKTRNQANDHGDGDGDGAVPTRRVDVPMRAFTAGYYPELLALYRHLRIRVAPSNFTYSFARSGYVSGSGSSSSSSSAEKGAGAGAGAGATAPRPFLLYNGASGLRGISLPSSIATTAAHPLRLWDTFTSARVYLSGLVSLVASYLSLLLIALFHYYTGHTRDPTHPLAQMTLDDLVATPFPARTRARAPPLGQGRLWVWVRPFFFLARRLRLGLGLRLSLSLSPHFVDETLVPLLSAVMTCSPASVHAAPAADILDYIALTLGRSHYVVRDGVRTVVDALMVHTPASAIHTDAAVTHVASVAAGEHYLTVNGNSNSNSNGKGTGTHGPYSHLIFATQAHHTARLYPASASALRVRYERATVVTHSDTRLLPPARADRRDLNLVSHATHPTMATHLLSPSPLLLQTTNPLPSLLPHQHAVHASSTFHRPVIDLPAKLARESLFSHHSINPHGIQGKHGIWLAGSWAKGIPLLEGCVFSARLVATAILQHEGLQLKAGVPWTVPT